MSNPNQAPQPTEGKVNYLGHEILLQPYEVFNLLSGKENVRELAGKTAWLAANGDSYDFSLSGKAGLENCRVTLENGAKSVRLVIPVPVDHQLSVALIKAESRLAKERKNAGQHTMFPDDEKGNINVEKTILDEVGASMLMDRSVGIEGRTVGAILMMGFTPQTSKSGDNIESITLSQTVEI